MGTFTAGIDLILATLSAPFSFFSSAMAIFSGLNFHFLTFSQTNMIASPLIQNAFFYFTPLAMLLLPNKVERNGQCVLTFRIYLHV